MPTNQSHDPNSSLRSILSRGTKKEMSRYQQGSLKDDGKGRWVIRWREPIFDPTTGEKRDVYRQELLSQKSFSIRDARKELAAKVAEVNSGTPKARGVTFAVFASKWKDQVMCHFKPSAQAGAQSILNRHLIPSFGDCPLDKITAEAIQAFVNEWTLGANTLSKVIRQMREMWDVAMAWGYATNNPFPRGVTGRPMLRMPTVPKPKTYNFTPEETMAIIAELKEEKWKLLVMFAAQAGIRPGELAGMRRSDLNGQMVTISQSIFRGQVQTPKTENAVRRFPIARALADRLRDYMEATKDEPNRHNLVWTNSAGGPVLMNHFITKTFNPILEKLGIRAKLDALGIEKCGMYALRHMNITELRRRNVPLKTIQKRVGHAQGTDVTDKFYVHANEADDLAAADILGELLNPTTEGPIQ